MASTSTASTQDPYRWVATSAQGPFRGRPENVRHLRKLVQQALTGVGWQAVVGECVRPRDQAGQFRFDLADPDYGWVHVVVNHDDRKRIESFLGRRLAEVLREGTVVAVNGPVAYGERGSSGWFLRASQISKASVKLGGSMHQQHQATLKALRTELWTNTRALDRLRMPDAEVHDLGKGAAAEIANMLNKHGITVRRVIAFRPKQSATNREFRDGFAKARLILDERDIPPSAEEFSRAIKKIERDSETIIAIHRGGGHWSDFQIFNSLVLASAVGSSDVPVLSGIGHKQDVTFVDRAAMASTSTPTALGRLIGSITYEQRSPRSHALAGRLTVTTQEEVPKDAKQATENTQQPTSGPTWDELFTARQDGWKHFDARVALIRRIALHRISTRARVLSTVWALASAVSVGAAITAGLQQHTEMVPVLGCAASVALVAAIVAATGPARALKAPRRNSAESPAFGTPQWFDQGYTVNAPRKYVRHLATPAPSTPALLSHDRGA